MGCWKILTASFRNSQTLLNQWFYVMLQFVSQLTSGETEVYLNNSLQGPDKNLKSLILTEIFEDLSIFDSFFTK